MVRNSGVWPVKDHHGLQVQVSIRQEWDDARLIIPGKSMVPLLSASTSLIMSCNSDSDGFCPRDRITVPSSLVVIWPVVISSGMNWQEHDTVGERKPGLDL
jgi:hypothetical protein